MHRHDQRHRAELRSELAVWLGLCACNASGCDAAPRYIDRFDLTVSGDTIEGSDTDHPGKRIHFTRVP